MSPETHQPPPDLRNATFNFDDFHPLDHWPLTRYCATLPGSHLNHLALTWEFRRAPQLRSFLLRPLCWSGRHDWHTLFRRVGSLEDWDFLPESRCRRCKAIAHSKR